MIGFSTFQLNWIIEFGQIFPLSTTPIRYVKVTILFNGMSKQSLSPSVNSIE
jgi:hypothetical protein